MLCQSERSGAYYRENLTSLINLVSRLHILMSLNVLLIPVPLLVLTMLAAYLMPSLTYMIHSFPFSPRIMSLTFLSFANAAPDLVTCFTALRQGTSSSASMAIGEVLGSACFGVCVVFGTISVMASTTYNTSGEEGLLHTKKHNGLKVTGSSWILDVGILWSTTLFIGYTISDGEITLFDSLVLVAINFTVISVWIWRSKSGGIFIDINKLEDTASDNEMAENVCVLAQDEESLRTHEQSENQLTYANLETIDENASQLEVQRFPQEYDSISTLSPNAAHLQRPRISDGSMIRSSSSTNSISSQSSDIADLYFHSHVQNLTRGDSWRLQLIDSVKLALVGSRNQKGGASSSRRSMMSSQRHHDLEANLNKTASKIVSTDLAESDTPVNETYPISAYETYKVYSTPPSKHNTPPRELWTVNKADIIPELPTKLRRKAPELAVTDIKGHQNIVKSELEDKTVRSAKPQLPALDTDVNEETCEQLLPPDVSETNSVTSSPHMIEASLSPVGYNYETEDFSGTIHFLTPSIWYRICPIHMLQHSYGVERTYNMIILPFLTIFNLLIPLPIPAELREKDIASFKWEFALTRKLFHFQLFWAPWIFSDFGSILDKDQYWQDLAKYVIFPSLALPILSWVLDKMILMGSLPIEMPEHVAFGAINSDAHPPDLSTTTDESKEIFPLFLSVVSFMYVIKLLSLVTSVLVDLLNALAQEYDLSESLLAITIVSLANSAGDVITAAALTKLERIDIAVSAVGGGTLCYLCGGVGGMTLLTLMLGTKAGSGPHKGEKLTSIPINLDTQIWFQLGEMLIMLTIFLIVIPYRNWLVERWVGVLGIGIWLSGIVFCWLSI